MLNIDRKNSFFVDVFCILKNVIVDCCKNMVKILAEKKYNDYLNI